MKSRLTGLIDMISRTQDVSTEAFSALTPPSSQSAAIAHEERVKRGHFEGVGLGVALQAHLREFSENPREVSSGDVSRDSDERRGSATGAFRNATVRKSGIELPANIVRVLEHHRKKGIARQQAYLNEAVLGASRPSRFTSRKRPTRQTAGRTSSKEPDDALRPASRLVDRRVTAGRLVAGSIIVGAPKGSAVARDRSQSKHVVQQGASRLAVQAAGTASCNFFSPDHFPTDASPSHSPPPILEKSDDQRSLSPNSMSPNSFSPGSSSPKDSPRSAPSFEKAVDDVSKSITNTVKQTSGRRVERGRKRSSKRPEPEGATKEKMQTLKSVIGAKVNAHVRRMTILATQPSSVSEPETLAMSLADPPAVPKSEDDSSKAEAATESRRLSAVDAQIAGPAGEARKMSQSRSSMVLNGTEELPSEPTTSNARKNSAVSQSTTGRKQRHIDFDADAKPGQNVDKASSAADLSRRCSEAVVDNTSPSETTSSINPLALWKGDRQPFQRRGVRLTVTPVSFKLTLPKKRKCWKPPTTPASPAAANGNNGTGEKSATAKQMASQARKNRRLSEVEMVRVPLKLIAWTSQRDNGRHAAVNLVNGDPGTLWESVGSTDESLTFDTGMDVEVCGLILRCLGTRADPKDVTLLRSNSEDGPWIIVRRTFVPAGPQHRDKRKHQFLFEPGGPAQFFRVVVHQNWGAAQHVSIFAPLELLARLPHDEGPERVENCELLSEVLQVCRTVRKRRSLTLLFSEALNLTKEDREVRTVARRHHIPLDWAERVRDEFRKFATGNELCYPEFEKIFTAILSSSACWRSAQKSDFANIPESRIRHLWNEVDLKNNGKVNFEDFLVWFHSMFFCDSAAACSSHSPRQAITVNERFYASLGRERLRQAVQKQQAKQRRQQDESTQ